LQRLASDRRDDVRSIAISSVAAGGHPAKIEILSGALSDRTSEIRRIAARALAAISGDSPILALRAGLSSADVAVRLVCAAGLASRADKDGEEMFLRTITADQSVAPEILEGLDDSGGVLRATLMRAAAGVDSALAAAARWYARPFQAQPPADSSPPSPATMAVWVDTLEGMSPGFEKAIQELWKAIEQGALAS